MTYNLGTAYMQAHSPIKAIEQFEPALKSMKEQLGTNDHTQLMLMTNLAGCYLTVGRTDNALPLAEEALKGKLSLLGESHADTWRAMSVLGSAHFAANQIPEAIDLFKRALRSRSAHLGREHSEVAWTINDLVWELAKVGGREGYLTNELIEDLRFACEENGEAALINTLAAAEYRVGRYDRAINTALLAIEKQSSSLPIDLAIIAMSYFKLDNSKQAEEYRHKMAEAMHRKNFKDDVACQSFANEVELLFGCVEVGTTEK